ncbi:MAG: acyltransferase [Gemmatimonadetes bacterium]|jgi:acetyltransferase-like isoleucine patch superfamily enzyme|nr:acyltransferase [Gemmatimonadota bacterium]MBA4157691.1 acyltransferase [Gemmatimonadota bacterium]
MTNVRKIASALAGLAEFLLVYACGRVCGLGPVVRYLRNPHPLATPRLLRAFGAEIGEASTFKRSLYIDNAYEDRNSARDFRHLHVGRDCYIGDGVYLDLANQVVIGDQVVISGRVSVLTHADCNRSPYLAEQFPRRCEPVVVGAGAWIGFGAIVTAGVRIGERTVIAAGALMRDNAEPRAVYGGVPARKLRELALEVPAPLDPAAPDPALT